MKIIASVSWACIRRGTRQQVIGGSDTGKAPIPGNTTLTDGDAGNLNNIIPVDTNGGLFKGANRKSWFDHLHGMTGQYSTPLRQALNAAGKYFSTAHAYRSKVGTEITYLACRQNFAILTTDGYWNNYNGNEDPNSQLHGQNQR